MLVDDFGKYFDHVVLADGGVDSLKSLILKLAMRGRLVSTREGGEPVEELLARIAEERAAVIAKGQIREPDLLPAADEHDLEFELPSTWATVRVGEIVTLEYGKNMPKANRDASGVVPVYGANGPTGFHSESLIETPCVIVGRKGSAGAVNVVLEHCWPTDVTYFVIPTGGLRLQFLAALLQSLSLPSLAKGIKPGLDRNEVYRLTVGLPPVDQQDRIMEKLEALRHMCDEIERTKNEIGVIDSQLAVSVAANVLES